MKEKILIMGLIAALLLPAVASAIEIPEFEPTMPDMDKMSEQRMQYMERAQEAHMFGMLNYEGDGQYSGYFVSFAFDAKEGTIYDYTMKGTVNRTVFSSVSIEKEDASAVPVVHGAVFLFNAADWNLVIHNNAPALMSIEKAGGASVEVTYILAEGITAEEGANGSYILNYGEQTALLLYGDNEAELENNTITIELATGSIVFRGYSLGAESAPGAVFRNLVQERRALGEISVTGTGAERAEDAATYCEGARIEVREMEQKRMELRVSDTDPEGKIVKICVDKESLGIDSPERVQALFDGENAVKKQDMNSLVQAMENGEQKAAYVAYEDGEQMNIYVYIPHFSEHTLTIEESTATSETGSIGNIPITTMALAGLALVAVIAGVVFLKRRN